MPKRKEEGVLTTSYLRKDFMLKNLFLLAITTWACFSYAAPTVVKESVTEAEAYKVEKPVEEQDAQRSVAGAKIKKKKGQVERVDSEIPNESDSEVRYWQYSE
jgi:peptidoglycan hydrolase CwlO-like protein